MKKDFGTQKHPAERNSEAENFNVNSIKYVKNNEHQPKSRRNSSLCES